MSLKDLSLSKGIYSPLCGWEWLVEHQNDPYPPVTFELIMPGIHHKITGASPETLKEVMRVNK